MRMSLPIVGAEPTATAEPIAKAEPTVRADPHTVPALRWTARIQPEALRARALSATLQARDLEKTVLWYSDVLRVTVQRRYERSGVLIAATMVAGSVRIVLEQAPAAIADGRSVAGQVHLWLTTTQDLDALAKGIEERGGMLETEPADFSPGKRAFSILDPDGVRLTLAQGFE
jgi:predicted enzyme related to lactoylglutathione lyase